MKAIQSTETRLKLLKQLRYASRKYFSDVRHKEQLEWLESWISAQEGLAAEGLDECPKCKSDPYKTPGGCPCEHCGAIGQQPWGG